MSAFTGIWCGLHLQLAQLSGNPEIAITEADGKQWLTSLQNVMRHYSIEASQKAVDWAAFAACSAFIYLPRVAAIAARRRAPQQRGGMPLQMGAGVVYPFPQASPATSGANGSAASPQPQSAAEPAPTVEPDFDLETEPIA